MRFRQYNINFWETQIFISICLIVGVIGMMLDSVLVPVLLIPSILSLIVLITEWVMKQNYILMNEEGIF